MNKRQTFEEGICIVANPALMLGVGIPYYAQQDIHQDLRTGNVLGLWKVVESCFQFFVAVFSLDPFRGLSKACFARLEPHASNSCSKLTRSNFDHVNSPRLVCTLAARNHSRLRSQIWLHSKTSWKQRRLSRRPNSY